MAANLTKSVWLRRAEELLANGPMPFGDILAEVGGLIPPGQAWRARESGRDWARRKYVGLPIEPDEINEKKLWAGRRIILRKSIWWAVKRGTMQREDRDGVAWFSLTTKTSSGSLEPTKSE